MEGIEKTLEGDLPSVLRPPDARNCERPVCAGCEELKDRLKKLTYCLAVAQRLTNMEPFQ